MCFKSVAAARGVFPILRYTCIFRANASVFGHFSLSVRRKTKKILSVPQLNLVILSFIEEEISQ